MRGDKGMITDLPYEWGENSRIATTGYTRECQDQASRIDTVISNEVGAQLVGEVDHVAIAVRLDGARIQQKVTRAGRPIGISLANHKYNLSTYKSPK